MEALYTYMGACSPRSRDSTKVCESHNNRYTSKGCDCCHAHEKAVMHLSLAEPPEALKPKEERTRQLFGIGL